MANSLLSARMLARIGLAYAIDHKWPFNQCEACYDYLNMLMILRFCDYSKPRKYAGRDEWACEYDYSCWADGSDQELHLEPHVAQWSVDRVRELIGLSIQNPWGLLQSCRTRSAGRDLIEVV